MGSGRACVDVVDGFAVVHGTEPVPGTAVEFGTAPHPPRVGPGRDAHQESGEESKATA